MITKATSPGYLYAVTTDSTCVITDVDTRYNLCKAIANKQGMFAAIGGSVECSDDNVVLTQASTVSGGTRFEVVATRPDIGEAGVIYLVPSSSSTTENLYEEWLWVDSKWEQIGSAGLNLSNYAQLTTANTFSADNTFNGKLIKKTSATDLADNSVLNRSEMDSRYGRLYGENFWYNSQHIGAGGTLTMHPNATIITNNIQGNSSASELNFNGLHLIGINDIEAAAINSHTIHTNTLKTRAIRAAQNTNKIDFTNSNGSGSINVSGINELRLSSVHATSEVTVPLVNTNAIAPISGGSIRIQGVNELVAMEPPANTQTTLSGIRFLKYSDVTVDSGGRAMLVQAPEGIKVATNQIYPSKVTIAPDRVEAFPLDPEIFSENRYGIYITDTSCQLFGIDFNYGDVWSETNDKLKAHNITPIPGLESANYVDTVKIRKPAVSIESTGVGSLSFDYANEAYIRTFPNDGGQGIFEFQAGNWADVDHRFIKRGPVDLRKASATTLGPTSVLNMEEGDARWGGGGGSKAVLVDSKIPDWMVSPQTALISVADTGPGGVFGVAIGPGVTANIYKDLAIGGWLNTSKGKGSNTLLGYGFNVASTAKGTVAIGQSETNSELHDNSIVIGYECIARGKNIIAIGGDVSGNLGISLKGNASTQAIALGGIANEKAITIGYDATAAKFGTALGAYSIAGINEFVMQTNGDPAISMQLYGGTDWNSHDTTGYLKFVAAPSAAEIKMMSSTKREEIIIHKKPLWDAIQRAKDYNYPAQPFVSLVGRDSGAVSSALASMKPNTIYHIATEGIDLDLSNMAFDDTIPGIASAELHIEIISGSNPSIIWPDIIAWPDEPDPIVAPTLTGSDTANKLYAIVVRKQVTTAGEFLVASVAYSFEY